jgi:glycogen(starch) synthase
VKILHLSSEYPPAKVYGLGRFVHGLARAQAAQGDDVLVLTNSSGGAEDDVVLDGVRVHRIAWPNPPQPSAGQGEVLQWNAGVIARLLERRDVFRDVDVVVGHDWLTAIAAREAARLLDRPLVVTFHDEVMGKHLGVLTPDARFVSELEALTAHDAAHVVANSDYMARQVVRHYGVDPSHVSAIPGGIDPTLLDVDRPELARDVRSTLAGDDELLVVYFGRLDPEKGLGALMDALERVRATRPDVRLALAGSGRLYAALEPRLRPGDRLLGYVKGQALGYLLRAADVVVIPSVYEPFGLVALEAMLAGAAVVTSSAGGLGEIVLDGEDGLVVSPGDAPALADAILRLAGSADLRRGLGRAAAARARRDFDWALIARRTRAAYEQAVGAPASVREAPPARPTPAPVSIVVLTQDAPLRAEAALRTILGRTAYACYDVRVLDHGSDPDVGRRLDALVAALADERVTLERLPGADATRARARALASAPCERVLLVSDAVEVLAGSERWLDGLVWLLDETGAERVSPTLVGRVAAAQEATPGLDGEPRRRDADPACELVRRSPLARPAGSAWTHPVRLLHARDDASELRASIVVVAYDGLAFTRDALQAVLAHTRPPYELVLVDNGSTDGTLALFREARDRLGGAVPVQVLETGSNLGYPAGANRGVAAARGWHVVLLNNDTQVRPGWLDALLAAADAPPTPGTVAAADAPPTPGTEVAAQPAAPPPVGIVTAKVLNLDGTVQSAGGIEHRPDGSFEIRWQGEDRLAPPVATRRRVRSAGGPCMLLTRALLDRLAPDGRVFDEAAFGPGYFEDSDLCQRARQACFDLVYEPGAEVVHHGKATANLVAREGRVDIWARFEQNRRLFHDRWAPELAHDLAARQAEDAPLPRQRILLCYHRSATTTAAYCEPALRRAHSVVTAGRGQELDLGDDVTAAALVRAAAGRLGGPIDLLLVIEGETFVPRELELAPCRTALWAIDTHLHARKEDDWHLVLGPRFDHVFVAQRDHVATFVRASWLPHACAPEVHRQPTPASGRDLDVVFVGHVRPFHERRRQLLERLSRRFRVAIHQGVWREDMARLFARAKVVWNCSLAGDLNMRVFEGLASGALVVTDRIGNGLDALLADREHLTLYGDDASLDDVVARALADHGGREAIAARGQGLALRHHTYAARMAQVVREALAAPLPDGRAVHVTTPYSCLGDRLCFVSAAREYARAHPGLRVTTDVLPEVVGAFGDGLLGVAPAGLVRVVVSAPVARHRRKGSSPDRTYVGTYAAGLGLPITQALAPELPALAPRPDLVPGAYVALQPLAGSAGNPPELRALLARLVATCRELRPDWPVVLVGRPDGTPRDLVPDARPDALGGPLELAQVVRHAGLVLTPRSAAAHVAAAYRVPTFLWLPGDGEDWHLDYSAWQTGRVTYADAPAVAVRALTRLLAQLAPALEGVAS